MPSNRNDFHGWTILAHPMFVAQLKSLAVEVKKLKQQHPDSFQKKNATKRLAAINQLAFEQVPSNPSDPIYRQGLTLGKARKHWFRAKFFQQYRLFFRYDEAARIIIYAWVNDEKTKRAYGSKTDAYSVFRKLVSAGTPPDSWQDLMNESQGIEDLDEFFKNL
ncbi:type II toxin-antitoxin system YhaV family toxin [Endozoicomonas sp. ALD040]|uniref:type II toxin-antitoxin system YhaV family toxin n=1 Tax=unclassified Endozoicomonas TaxID=2644528 RepID=UPI003BAEC448